MKSNEITICLQWIKTVNPLFIQEKYAAQQRAKALRDPSLDDLKIYILATEIIEQTKNNLKERAFQLAQTERDNDRISLALSKPLSLLCHPKYLEMLLEKIIKGEAEPEEPVIEESDSETDASESDFSDSEVEVPE